MDRLLRAAELALVALLAAAIVAATTGWLYLLEPHTRIGRPLVLDALPRMSCRAMRLSRWLSLSPSGWRRAGCSGSWRRWLGSSG